MKMYFIPFCLISACVTSTGDRADYSEPTEARETFQTDPTAAVLSQGQVTLRHEDDCTPEDDTFERGPEAELGLAVSLSERSGEGNIRPGKAQLYSRYRCPKKSN